MRLVCPNCGAQYEIDDRVIPDNGRDVQCSSCGHAWYQMPASAETAPVDASEIDETDDALPAYDPDNDAEDGQDTPAEVPEPEAGQAPVAPVAPVADPASAPADTSPGTPSDTGHDAGHADADPQDVAHRGPGARAGEADDADGAGTGPEDDEAHDPADAGATETSYAPEGVIAPRRELDDNLRAILQEERAREMAARAADDGVDAPEAATATEDPAAPTAPDSPSSAETPAQETAPEAATGQDGDLEDDALAEFGPVPGRDAEGADIAAAAPLAAGADTAARKNLFPDIEEINSTLDSRGQDEVEEIAAPVERRGGFGRAFFTIIFIAALLLALYLVAPRLAESVPALEPALSGYVDAVNAARAAIESMMQGVTSQIDAAE